MSALRRKLEEIPPGSLVPRDWLLAQLRNEDVVRETRRRMVGSRDACQLLGVDDRKLRRWAAKWEQQFLRGMDVEVKVERKSNAKHSDYLFDRSDLMAYRAKLGRSHQLGVVDGGRGRPPKGSDTGPALDDEVEAIADDYIRRNHA